MKENLFKAALVTISTGVAIYFREMAIPILVLISVMGIDYITGMIKAMVNHQLSSRAGITGILKKVCYLFIIAVAMIADWLIQSALLQVGLRIDVTYAVGLLVTVWLIINEMISILENVAAVGGPVPGFLTKLIGRLKIVAEQKLNEERVGQIPLEKEEDSNVKRN